MRIEFHPSSLLQTRWYELFVRFLFGGLITAGAGVIARKFGPVVGGLFLAFPAIFPASATLIEKHEKQRKEKAGMNGDDRGRRRRVWMPQAPRLEVSACGFLLCSSVD